MNVAPDARAALGDHLTRMKHDLGKYVSLQVRWVGAGAEATALREALEADLLGTRRGPSGTADALAVWSEFRPALVGEAPLPDGPTVDLTGDEDLARLDRAMDAVARTIALLRAGCAGDDELRRGAAAAAEAADACRSLWARSRGG